MMVINNGDKLVVKKTVAEFLKEDDIAKVTSVSNGMITFAFGENFMHMGMMTIDECENHFEKFVEKAKAPTVTFEDIQNIVDNSEFEIFTIFDKCTVVACKLPNGFVIVESSACVSPENYDEKMGVDICTDKIVSKIWELEGYKLQDEVHKAKMANMNMSKHTCDCCDCEDNAKVGVSLEEIFNKIFGVYEEEKKEDDFDECLDTDLDCYDCEDYGCPWNPNTHTT